MPGAAPLLLSSLTLAADPALAIVKQRLEAATPMSDTKFGETITAGDLNGDGYAELVIASRVAVHVFAPNPGPAGNWSVQLLTRQRDYGEDAAVYGATLAIDDVDGDGAAELLVAAPEYEGAVYVYHTGPAGVELSTEWMLQPLDGGGTRSPDFGSGLGTGDLNGDGVPEVAVGAPHWEGEGAGEMDLPTGAVYVYAFDQVAGSPCEETRVDVPHEAIGNTWWPDFGYTVLADADTNGDGYDDLAVDCLGCAMVECPTCSAVLVWLGAAIPSFTSEEAILLGRGVPPHAGNADYFGMRMSSADVDADGFDDLILSSNYGPSRSMGSPTGPEAATQVGIGLAGGQSVANLGDLDADGFDDVLVSSGDDFTQTGSPGYADILFGSEEGWREEDQLRLSAEVAGTGFGNALAGLGDINGDGRPDFLVGADFESLSAGAAYVYTPVCTWYLDADADGFGDPGTTRSSCRDEAGYAPRPDDCDDADASVYGALWYPDADGDGFGVTDGGALACAQPSNTAAAPGDCEDEDPSRYPGAADTTTDGVDQDCDGRDGGWVLEPSDCGDDTAGDTAVDTGADSGADTGADTAAESGLDSGGDPAPDSEADVPVEVTEPECGCAAAGSTGWLGLLAATSMLWRSGRRGDPRRRSPLPGAHRGS